MRFVVYIFILLFSITAHSAHIEQEVLDRFNQGLVQDLIVEFDDSDVEQEIFSARVKNKLKVDNADILNIKRKGYLSIKTQLKQLESKQEIGDVKDYNFLPISVKRFKSLKRLNAFIASGKVKAVYTDKMMYKTLAQSLPLINQTTVSNLNYRGAGTTVVVIDDGIDYTKSAFGSCTAVATPTSSCRVIVSNNIVTSGAVGVTSGHGTNVAATVLGVAPDTKIAAINVFNTSSSASSSDILSAINWSITNQTAYNIVAINMSLGGGDRNKTVCSNSLYTSAIQKAKDAGIHVVVASGNSAYSDGISSPACAPAAISVGAVYDSNVGAVTYSMCSDSTSSADKVTCFSNSASYLTVLAPGAFVTAAGLTYAGTSQASPHVAGAVAVLRSAFPNESAAQIQTRLISHSTTVTDSRNNISKPRLNLMASARPQNDNFESRSQFSGASGSFSGTNILATAETNEPIHADLAANNSIWFKWTAPASGQVKLQTSGTLLKPRLAVYTGTTLSGLTAKVVSSDALSNPVYFQSVSGTQYQIAINTLNADAGNFVFDWELNTNASANLSVVLNGANDIVLGNPYFYTLSVANTGPSNATNVSVNINLPDGADFLSADQSCQAVGKLVTCRVSQLNVGTVASFRLNLVWNAISDGTSLSISANSDLADSDSSDNAKTFTVAKSESANVTDVPTLPEWGMIIMGLMLLFLNRRSNSNI